MIKVIHVAGARPNFMKVAPIMGAMSNASARFSQVLVHTGQHYDDAMSQTFLDDLGLPRPDVNLGVGSGTHGEQTARIMTEFEKFCVVERPDLVIVVGDVNSTLACALTAKKLGMDVAHVEAGLRSRDMAMPEEINRICTDAIADHLFTTDTLADENLIAEGVSREKIHFVGNVMVDTLLKHRARAAALGLVEELGLRGRVFGTLTLHRPTNVDDPVILREILDALRELSERLPIVFPVHPRTRERIERFGLSNRLSSTQPASGLWACRPLGYLEFLHLNLHASLVLTDSGGLQEETTVLGVPCLTLRSNTERPITCTIGTNRIVGNRGADIIAAALAALCAAAPRGALPDKWDGNAAGRIVSVLSEVYR